MQTNLECGFQDSFEYLLQFIIRIIIIVLALFSTLGILITCYLSGKSKCWPFKILIYQCFAELIDLIGSLLLTYNTACHLTMCKILGYIMNCSWQTSFLCSFLIIYMFSMTLQNDSIKYIQRNKQLTRILISFFIIPYIWLLFPLFNGIFGPEGWKLTNQSKFSIFCGFRKRYDSNHFAIYYSIFWTLPIIIIFGASGFFAWKNKKFISRLKQTSIQEESLDGLKLIEGVQVFPWIYGTIWGVNVIARYIHLFFDQILNHKAGLIIQSVLNQAFELHICLIFILFYKNYNPILNIKQLWLRQLQKIFRKKKVDNESNIMTQLNESDSED